VNEHSFKIGDKVKACSSDNYNYEMDEHIHREGVIGIVKGIVKGPSSKKVLVQWNTTKCVICGDDDCGALVTACHCRFHEIKHAMMKGEQLLLFEL